jgi:hypothetical protein
LMLGGLLPPSLGDHERLEVGPRTSFEGWPVVGFAFEHLAKTSGALP